MGKMHAVVGVVLSDGKFVIPAQGQLADKLAVRDKVGTYGVYEKRQANKLLAADSEFETVIFASSKTQGKAEFVGDKPNQASMDAVEREYRRRNSSEIEEVVRVRRSGQGEADDAETASGVQYSTPFRSRRVIVPYMRGPLCELAYRIVGDVNKRLGRAARSNGRRRLQEVSITSTILDLIDDANADGLPVWVQEFSSFAESRNGADIELWILDRASNRSVGWLIQAKRLYLPRASTSPEFGSIHHDVRGVRQVDLLEEYAMAKPGLNPVYWLYGWAFNNSTGTASNSPCICSPRSFDQAVMVAPSSVVRNNWGSKSWHDLVHKQGSVVSLPNLWCGPGPYFWESWDSLGRYPPWPDYRGRPYPYRDRHGLPGYAENLIRGEAPASPPSVTFLLDEQRPVNQTEITVAPKALVVVEINAADS